MYSLCLKISVWDGGNICHWVHPSIIKHLKSLRMTRITHISRGQNAVSDFLASFARTERRTVVWLGSGPPEVIDFCKDECKVAA